MLAASANASIASASLCNQHQHNIPSHFSNLFVPFYRVSLFFRQVSRETRNYIMKRFISIVKGLAPLITFLNGFVEHDYKTTLRVSKWSVDKSYSSYSKYCA